MFKLGDQINIEQLQAHNMAQGYYFFSKSSMRFFKSRTCPEVFAAPDGWYFVSSEQFENDPRRYTVRIMRENGQIDDLGGHDNFQKHASKRAAIAEIKSHLGV